MKTLLLALLGLISSPTWAALPSAVTTEYLLNQGAPSAARDVQLGTQLTKLKTQLAKATYDFAKLGGSSTVHLTLRGTDNKSVAIPDNAIIKQVLIDVLTQPTPASATIALTADTLGDLKGATATATYTGLLAGVPIGSAATMFKVDGASTVSMKVGGSSLTAGKFNVFIEYYLSD